MSEKRPAPSQHKTFLRGLAYFGNNPSAVDCVVREMSETDARLKFSGPPLYSENFELHVPIRGRSWRATVRWHEGDELGIALSTVGLASTGTEPGDARLDRLEAEIVALKQIVKRLQRMAGDKTEAA